MKRTETDSTSGGWTLVSNNPNNSLRPTGVVHHVDGCGMNNGRNVLYQLPPEETERMAHCLKCEKKLGLTDAPVWRQSEGTKIEVRLLPEVLGRVDNLARDSGLSRAATLRSLIETGLASR